MRTSAGSLASLELVSRDCTANHFPCYGSPSERKERRFLGENDANTHFPLFYRKQLFAADECALGLIRVHGHIAKTGRFS